jgi:hypothetical protein
MKTIEITPQYFTASGGLFDSRRRYLRRGPTGIMLYIDPPFIAAGGYDAPVFNADLTARRIYVVVPL